MVISPGATVRYTEPRSGRTRIGRVEKVLTRGKNKGWLIVTPCSTTDHARSLVKPDNIKVKG